MARARTFAVCAGMIFVGILWGNLNQGDSLFV